MKFNAYLIGVQDYQYVQPLQTPLSDIRDIGTVLVDRYGYAVQYCENPSLENLKSFLEGVAGSGEGNAVARDSFAVIYYAGHGIAQDSETGIRGFLIPADGRREARETWLSMTDLVAFIERLPFWHTLIMLDCCFSGSLRWAANYRSLAGFSSQKKLYRQHYRHFMERRSCQVLTSSAPDQLAIDFVREGTASEHSPFAACILQGLEGEADGAPDKVITGAELFAYLQSRLTAVSSQYGNPQNPGLFPLKNHDFGDFLFFMEGFHPDQLELLDYHNPYRGLSAYEPVDKNDFFGRSKAIEELLAEVRSNPLTVVVGASGTGKSSLVKAGIIPRLSRQGAGKIAVIKPGLTPLAELPDPSDYDVLVIDQLEQIITQADEEKAGVFLLHLEQLLKAGKKVISTLRIDYESRLPKPPGLEPYWRRFLVPPFSAEELREVIVTPTFRQGRFIVPMHLVDRIIEEVIHYPGALPLLSFTMRELFERCQEGPYRNITPADYNKLNGVIGALQKKADSLYDTLPDDAYRHTMYCLMLRMVSLTGGQVASKRVLLENLHFSDPAEQERIQYVRNRMEEERLIVADTDHSGRGFIEPVHDALVNTWDKIQQWVKFIGDANLLLCNELEAAEYKYRRSGSNNGLLWHNNASLEQVGLLQQPDNHLFLFNDREWAFIEASKKEKNRRQRRNTTITTVVISVISILLVLSVLFAQNERHLRIEGEKRAEANQLASSGMRLMTSDPNQCRDLLLQAYRTMPDENIADLLHQTIPHSIFWIKKIQVRNPKVLLAEYCNEYENILIAYADSIVQMISAKDSSRVVEENNWNQFNYDRYRECFTADYKQKIKELLVSENRKAGRNEDLHANRHLQIAYNDEYSREIKLLTPESLTVGVLRGHEDNINAAAISQSSTFIITSSDDKTVKVWTPKGNLLHNLAGSPEPIRNSFLSAGERFVLSFNYVNGVNSQLNTLFIWQLKGVPWKSYLRSTKISDPLDFSDYYFSYPANDSTLINMKDSSMCASGQCVELLNIYTGRSKLMDCAYWESYSDAPIAILPNRNLFAYITDQSHDCVIRDFAGNTVGKYIDSVYRAQLVFRHPSEQFVVVSNGSDSLRFIDLNGHFIRQIKMEAFAAENDYLVMHTLKFLPDGKSFVVGASDFIYFYNDTGKLIRKIPSSDVVLSVDVSGDGLIACVDNSRNLTVLDTAGRQHALVQSADPFQITKVKFVPQKKAIVTLGIYGTTKLWDYRGRPLYQFIEMPIAWNVNIHRDNLYVSGRNEIKIWILPNLVEDFLDK